MTAEDKARALKLMTYFGRYGGHRSEGCSNLSFGNPASDYCDCGLASARGAFNELVVLLQRQEVTE